MTADALTRLVQRTLRPEPTLQPYAPSIFETSASGDDPGLVVQEVTASAPPPVSRVVTGPAEWIGRAMTPDANAWAAAAPPVYQSAEPAVVAHAQPWRPTQVEVAVTAVEASNERPPAGVERERVVERLIQRVSVERASRDPRSQQPPPVSVARAPVPEPTMSATPASVLMPAEHPSEQLAPEPPSEPVISISIGRIDVRAATPASAPPGPSRPRERRVMSLDDYLERRASGSHE